MKAASPISLKISLKSIREGRTQSLDQCLARDYNICCHIMRRTVSIDYFEGTRAMLLDKENTPPKWEPARLELVSDEMVGRYFSRVDEDDWESLQLPARSNSVSMMRPKL
ncbi:3-HYDROXYISOBUTYRYL-COA HYDROLASE 1-LIKE [Salix purpurea]|uniref:3-hydroxyisobutyryl-CoA hydrolase n=1 Tax=Salix purpurea TaxID=77065 RepID=A0A9Q0T1Z2_SALPP|nr:3-HYDROXYISOBUTYRYL-COA HYDROLASE 1-LIKE [Salix purpurea]